MRAKGGEDTVQVRRVVTAYDERNKSVFASDDSVAAITSPALPGYSFVRLWSADERPCFPGGVFDCPRSNWYPPSSGVRFALCTIPPDGQGGAITLDDPMSALLEFDRQAPGMLAHVESDDPGMHTSDSVDFVVLLSGELCLELDDGAETTLRPGDTVIQNGTRHRWTNRGDAPATLAVVLVGASRRDDEASLEPTDAP